MFAMMILSYSVFAFLDLKATYKKQGKYKLIVYFTLMAISWGIGTASGYVDKMPSPAGLIEKIVFAFLGK